LIETSIKSRIKLIASLVISLTRRTFSQQTGLNPNKAGEKLGGKLESPVLRLSDH
jgi:hypothetical protein